MVPDSHNPHGVIFESIEEAVRRNNDLAEGQIRELRKDPTGLRIIAKSR